MPSAPENELDPSRQVLALRPYARPDLALLRAMNTERMWAHLGGPESEEKVLARHERFLAAAPGNRQFVILVAGTEAGAVGYWPHNWRDEDAHEAGWMVLPSFQGHGVATQAVRLALGALAAEITGARVHAFPSVSNPASNAVCRKARFTLLGETEFEFPKGHLMRCNDWRIAL